MSDTRSETPSTAATETPAATLPWVSAPVDVFENDEHYLVRADVPGVSKGDVEIRFHDGELRLEATRYESQAPEPQRGVVFRRALAFPDDVDPDAITAALNDGVLELHLAKAAKNRPRRISITA